MAKSNKEINPGGINGTGTGVVNVNSKDYRGLQAAILEHAKKQTTEEKIRYKLISLKFQMETYVDQKDITDITDVGVFLRSHLKAIGIKNKAFAQYLNVEASNLSAIINGKRKINIDFAFKLGQVFDMNPNLWLLIQSKNELLQLEQERKLKSKRYRLEDLLKKSA